MVDDRPRQVILDCIDRWGRPVVLYADTWERHIAADHFELDSIDANKDFSPIEETVRYAHLVMHDKSRADREVFYRYGALPGYPRQYLKVCVEYGPLDSSDAIVSGTVVTAYPISKLPRGEVQKWP